MNRILNNLKTFSKLFMAMYIFIYCFPFPINYMPYGYQLLGKYINNFKAKLNILTAEYLLGYKSVSYQEMNGSGDTTLDYVALLSYSLVAVIIVLVFRLVFRKFDLIDKVYPAALVYARYFVGITLVSYGVIKFLHGQFPSPSLMALETTYGESSPMGLAWRFFGYSSLYKGFMGVSEILAGMLLLFRRTVLLGALLSIAVCTNIFIVNLSFDVPVKLFSCHLLMFSILVALPYFKSLISFFILHQPTQIRPISYPLVSKWDKIGYYGAKTILVALIPMSLAYGHIASQSFRTYLNEWEGVYEVTHFEIAGKENLSATAHWEKVIIQGQTIMTINRAKTKNYYTIEQIWNEGEINFISSSDQEDPYQLFVTELEDGTYSLTTTIGNNQYHVKAKRKIKADYLLMNRGFRFINELPFNR